MAHIVSLGGDFFWNRKHAITVRGKEIATYECQKKKAIGWALPENTEIAWRAAAAARRIIYNVKSNESKTEKSVVSFFSEPLMSNFCVRFQWKSKAPACAAQGFGTQIACEIPKGES